MGFQSKTNPGSQRAQWFRGLAMETNSPEFEPRFLCNNLRPVTLSVLTVEPTGVVVYLKGGRM